ncbi:M16 family metallopeptidase [Aequorivita echinoideorum]|uniref:Insulinase family protein n=1 Tax=Aequorivita echinoideorum TaxID=1549647 RepID=A0ABS5S183_9FLAO|nr:pitrilysin family protein [Aequorivita echinoideorum]MBT0606939.1 insulinase family protein [Aequorivita echinoideorum]
MKKYIYLFIASIFISTLATAQIDRSKQPKPGPAPKINLTQPSSFDLPNGLKVMVVENHKLPAVRVQLLIDNPIHASGEKAGVESLFSQMMGNGTTNIPKDQFNEEVDYLGASIFFGSESAYASSLSEYFPRIMELMADAIKNPLLTEEEFKKEKDKLIDGLKTQEKDVSTVASRVRSSLLYGSNHPKGEFTTIEKVEKLTLADVKDFYEDFFNPRNAYLVVVGDVSRKNVETLVRANLADWASNAARSYSYTEPKDVQFTQVNFVDMPNAVQSELAVQNLVKLKMSDPDYHAVLIANKILGGGFNSLLNMNLREEHGWTYGARSSTGADKNITRFIATTSVRNAVTDSAVVETLKEIRYLRDNKVTPQQLANAKAKFVGDFVLALERPETIADYALEIETQNLSKDFYVDYLKKINAVTAEDVQRVAKKYYKPGNLRIVVVGKGSEVLDGLKNLKNAEGKEIPVQYFDKFGNPVAAPDYNKAMDAGVTAETVINKYIDAIGGREKLEAVKSLMVTATAEMQGMQLGLETKNTTKSQSLVNVTMGGTSIQKIVFDGEKGYMMVQGQRIDYDAKQNAAAKMEALPFMELQVKDAKLERMEQVDGKDAYVISTGENTEIFYEKESGLKVKQNTVTEMMGQTINATTTFGNYKEVNGIKLPYTIGQTAGPQVLTFNITDVKINEGVSDADFN